MQIVNPDRSLKERKRELTGRIKQVECWLADMSRYYHQTIDKINYLRTVNDSKDCLKLLNELGRNTNAIYDLYATALKMIIDINYRELFEMVENMYENKKKAE